MESWLRRPEKRELKSLYASTGSAYVFENWRSWSESNRSFKHLLNGSMVDSGYGRGSNHEIYRIGQKRIVDDVILSQLEDLEKETLKWCIEITWNIPTTICVLKAGVHSVMGMADFKYVFSTNCYRKMSYCMGLEAMPHSYSMLWCLSSFPCGAVPVTKEEELPPDISSCGSDGAAKKTA
ncbi:hypothetical protein F2Q69_00039597 [Brassica cretica]|uniref:Uncharacterized protein n=1 Tax=Brassica cretica TaxID=69181 RepID=A0A8S9NV13_BRACR|nr:hypothetical protein F2Q69_00039597 [Brassica cretica]